MTKLNILIAVPAYRGTVKTGCVMTLMRAIRVLTERGIPHQLIMPDGNGIDTIRNIIASRLLQDKARTHVLFLDDDMEVARTTFEAMLGANKEVIGLAAPKRKIDLAKLREQPKDMPLSEALSASSEFNLKRLKNEKPAENGILRVDGVGLAVSLIARSAFEKLLATRTIRTMKTHAYADGGLTTPLYGFFDPIRTAETDLPEDLAFCERWRTLGKGEVWALINESVGHIGDFTYRGKYLDHLEKAKAKTT